MNEFKSGFLATLGVIAAILTILFVLVCLSDLNHFLTRVFADRYVQRFVFVVFTAIPSFYFLVYSLNKLVEGNKTISELVVHSLSVIILSLLLLVEVLYFGSKLHLVLFFIAYGSLLIGIAVFNLIKKNKLEK